MARVTQEIGSLVRKVVQGKRPLSEKLGSRLLAHKLRFWEP
jgi:hypothetical protein